MMGRVIGTNVITLIGFSLHSSWCGLDSVSGNLTLLLQHHTVNIDKGAFIAILACLLSVLFLRTIC